MSPPRRRASGKSVKGANMNIKQRFSAIASEENTLIQKFKKYGTVLIACLLFMPFIIIWVLGFIVGTKAIDTMPDWFELIIPDARLRGHD